MDFFQRRKANRVSLVKLANSHVTSWVMMKPWYEDMVSAVIEPYSVATILEILMFCVKFMII